VARFLKIRGLVKTEEAEPETKTPTEVSRKRKRRKPLTYREDVFDYTAGDSDYNPNVASSSKKTRSSSQQVST
jgi:hypothetical protein